MPVALKKTVEIPEKVEVKVEDNSVEVSGEKGKLRRKFDFPSVKLKMEDKMLSLIHI